MSGATPAEEAALREAALRSLDRLIAEAPPCTVDEAMEAMRRAVTLRDHLVARQRAGAEDPGLAARLACVNMTLSLTWSGAVPTEGFRKDLLKRARAALASCDTAGATE